MGTKQDKIRQQQRPQVEGARQNVHGEGNYAAARQYNDATCKYAESGKAEAAARAAAPRDEHERRAMAAAEAEGRRHAKEEDPALDRPAARRPAGGAEEQQIPQPGQDKE